MQSLRWAARPARSPLEQRVQWLTTAAFAANTAWSAHTVLRGVNWTGLGVIAAGATSANAALLAARSDASPGAQWASTTVAPLAGWLTVACFVNLDQALNAASGRPEPEAADKRSAKLVLGASAAAAALTGASGGSLPYAGAAGWGLATTGVQALRSGNRQTALAAGLGLLAVAAAWLVARRR